MDRLMPVVRMGACEYPKSALERDQTNSVSRLLSNPSLQDKPLRCQPVLDLAPRELAWQHQVDLVLRRKTAIAYLWESIARWQF
jgi:hypothetical protein